jgi:hypothetical protein
VKICVNLWQKFAAVQADGDVRIAHMLAMGYYTRVPQAANPSNWKTGRKLAKLKRRLF